MCVTASSAPKVRYAVCCLQTVSRSVRKSVWSVAKSIGEGSAVVMEAEAGNLKTVAPGGDVDGRTDGWRVSEAGGVGVYGEVGVVPHWGTVDGDHWNVGYSPSGEAQKARLLGTHCQTPTGSPRVDKVKPTLK
ncbi:hypothetical protein E2C01_050516 [Portunus trituberculatus]|uniref:Uncharacterized protein n=1 Tax=Portunus trituberculatus TaxID=210409 RepID=A0A5B7GJ64_PORTR|nr:hypothetical protein [Portunus trituberculatus]